MCVLGGRGAQRVSEKIDTQERGTYGVLLKYVHRNECTSGNDFRSSLQLLNVCLENKNEHVAFVLN